MLRLRFTSHTWLALGLIAVIALVTMLPAQAGPITNGPNSAPFTKLGVYGGVLTILDGSQAMEIGNNGRDIGSTGDLYFRPQLPESRGIRFFKNGSAEDVLITGKLCLNGSGSQDCRDVWPTAGGGNYWQVNSGYLEPNTATYALGVGTSSQRVQNGPALDVHGSGYYGLQVINRDTSGLSQAMQADGNVFSDGETVVGRKIYVNGSEVWHPGYPAAGIAPHQGEGSGLDADRYVSPFGDFENVTLEPAASCASILGPFGQPNPGGDKTLACLCVATDIGKKCAPMWNHI